MILVDTSVWIEFLRGRRTAQADFLARLIDEEENICICGMVLTEILQGIRDEDQALRTEHLLSDLIYLPTHRTAHLLAAQIYRSKPSTIWRWSSPWRQHMLCVGSR